MKTLKFIVDIEGNNVRTEGFEKDGNITLDEAGLSTVNLSDKELVEEALIEMTETEFDAKGEKVNVIVEFEL